MRRTATIAAGLLLGASLLSGCGGNDDGSTAGKGYCGELKSARKELDALSGNAVPNDKDFATFLDRARKLRDEAPAAVKDDWKVLDGTLEDLKKAFDDAGITLEQFSQAASGANPPGVDAAKLQQLGTKLQGLSNDKLEKATEAIQKHAKDECKIDLQDSSSSK